jgi:chromosome segregation ATPase
LAETRSLLEKAAAQLSSERDQAVTNQMRLGDALATMQSTLAAAEEGIAGAEQMVASATAQLAEAQSQCEQAQAEAANLRGLRQRDRAEIEAERVQIAAEKAQIASERVRIGNERAQFANERGQFSEALAALRAEREAAESRAAQSAAAAEGLIARLADATGEVEQVKSANVQLASRAAVLEEQADWAGRQIARLVEEGAEAAANSEVAVAALATELFQLRVQIRTSVERLVQTQISEELDLPEIMDKVRIRIRELERDLDRAEAQRQQQHQVAAPSRPENGLKLTSLLGRLFATWKTRPASPVA